MFCVAAVGRILPVPCQSCSRPNPRLEKWVKAWIWDEEMTLGYPGRPRLITWGLKIRESLLAVIRVSPLQTKGQRDMMWVGLKPLLLAFKWNKWAMSQGMQKAARSWKLKGNRLPPRACKKGGSLLTPWFWPSETSAILPTYSTVRWQFMLSHCMCGNLLKQQ